MQPTHTQTAQTAQTTATPRQSTTHSLTQIPGPSPQEFIWAAGIESTFVPQTRGGQRSLDEYELMGHYDHWRDDLALVRHTGFRALRWGVPWYRVEPEQGRFDWSWTDRVLPYMVEELGITPILDLMHYGCPRWLRGEFANPHYPRAVAAYAEAVARRYGRLVQWYTPLNEPIINSTMCGKRGIWPPYLRGDSGYVRIMLQLVKGIMATVSALKQAQPDAIMVHVDAAGLVRSARRDLEAIAREDQYKQYLHYDLITGKLTPEHPLFSWLVRNGAPPDDLARIASHPLTLDVQGLNFYPQWSTQLVSTNRVGQLAYRLTERAGDGFAEMLAMYYQRYRVPIIVTETSARGTNALRSRWLASSVGAIRSVRAQGVPVHGFTWYPIFTMIDWRYRLGRAPMERYRIELGLYRQGAEGGARWVGTPLVEQIQDYMAHPANVVGWVDDRR